MFNLDHQAVPFSCLRSHTHHQSLYGILMRGKAVPVLAVVPLPSRVLVLVRTPTGRTLGVIACASRGASQTRVVARAECVILVHRQL